MPDVPHDDERWMQRAVDLASSARPSPNPRCGAVIVYKGELVADGFHAAAGSDHAEVVALKRAGERARGATLYVTLEPHNYHGRTPPCTDRIVAAGVARVVVGVRDPNPRVNGGGCAELRGAGIVVDEAVLAPLCAATIRGWAHVIATARPFVTLKVAMSLDGRVATRTGESQWITNAEARRDGHRLRAQHDAVLVGIGTVLADDPQLTVRDAALPVVSAPPPARVVVDSLLRTPLASALVRTAAEVPTWIAHRDDAPVERADALRARSVELIALPARGAHVDLHALLETLARRGVTEVLAEGGSTLHGALLDRGFGNALVGYIAPMLLGGRESLPAIGGLGVAHLSEAPRLRSWTIESLGDNLKLTAEIEHVHRDHH